MDLSENVRVFVRICLQPPTLSKLDPKMRASDWNPAASCNKNSFQLGKQQQGRLGMWVAGPIHHWTLQVLQDLSCVT